MDLEQGFRIEDLIALVRRRAGAVGAVAGGVFLAAVFVASVLPNVYESKATLLVEPQTISARLVEAGQPQSDINNRLHLIQMQILSRGRLSRVIDDLDVYPEESQKMTREEIIALMRGQILVIPVLPELEARAGMRGSQRIEINTFEVRFRHRSPTIAAGVANRISSDFIDEHIKARVEILGDTSEFIEAELGRLSARIADLEQRIATVKSENTGKLPEDLNVNQRQNERILSGLREAQAALATAESDEAFYRQQTLAGGLEYRSSEVSPARRLDSLRLVLGEYESRGFTQKHPDIVSIKVEIAELEAQIAASGDSEEPDSMSIAQQNASAEGNRAALRSNAARQEIARLQQQLVEVEDRIAATPRVAEQLAGLTREYTHLQRSYQDFSNKRLEASVAADMERRQKGEQFRILEAAFPSPSPASPNRVIIIALGIMLGLALGAGLALLLEVTDASFRDARSLQARLSLPVLASIPSVVLESDRVQERRRRWRLTFAAATLASLVILASVAGNWMVNGVPGPVKKLMGDDAAITQAAGE